MTGSIYSWSTTAGDNDDADGDINWTEGQNAKTVNNSARQMMGRVAELLLDLGGQGTVGGTANAITLTLESSFTALVDGLMCTFQPASDNTGAVTINVNSIGSKSIRKFDTTGEVALAAKDLQAGNFYSLIYDTGANSSAGAWIVLNPTVPAFSDVAVSGSASDLTTGTLPDARLPARLGRLIKVVTDWNDAIESGWYGGQGASNAPTTTIWYYGTVITQATGYVTQTVHAFTADSSSDTKAYRRDCNGGTWSDWYRLRLSETEQAALWAALTDLASTASGKGASLVGIQDSGGKITATTVEGALAEVAGRLDDIGSEIAGLSAGAVGSYVLGMHTGATRNFGDTTSGANIKPVSTTDNGTFHAASSALSGTWLCLGFIDSTAARSTLFMRVS